MEATLNAVMRDDFGKNAVRRLRRKGMIPAVLYGGAPRGDGGRPEATPIAVDPKVLQRILHSGLGANTLIGLHVGDDESRVMIREYQLDPVTHALLHADFYRVALDKRVIVTVPVVLKGEARGVKQQGGLLDFVHRDIEVECLPADIPERIEVDVSESSAANAVWIGDRVLFPSSFPLTRQRLEEAGLHLKIVDATEVAKAEGAVTCCSLIFRWT